MLHEKTDNATNGGEFDIDTSKPYIVTAKIIGQADLLLHRWNAEAVDEKAATRKGSAGKKTDNLESYVWRDADGFLCLPGDYLRGAIVNAARYTQDPRSPRKSGMDLFKAGVVATTTLASLGVKAWDYEDRRRAVVQRQGINRTRPAMRAGWTAEINLMVLTPEYISHEKLRDVIGMAGRLVGVGDFRPTYGRFALIGYDVIKD